MIVKIVKTSEIRLRKFKKKKYKFNKDLKT